MPGKFAFEEVSYEHDPRLPGCLGTGRTHHGGLQRRAIRHSASPGPGFHLGNRRWQGGLSRPGCRPRRRIRRTRFQCRGCSSIAGTRCPTAVGLTYPGHRSAGQCYGAGDQRSRGDPLIDRRPRWWCCRDCRWQRCGCAGLGVQTRTAVALYTPILGLNAAIAPTICTAGGDEAADVAVGARSDVVTEPIAG